MLSYRFYSAEVVTVNYWHGLLRDQLSRRSTQLDPPHTEVLQLMLTMTAGVMTRMKHDQFTVSMCTVVTLKCHDKFFLSKNLHNVMI